MARGFRLKAMTSSIKCTPQWTQFLTDKIETELSLCGFLNILIPFSEHQEAWSLVLTPYRTLTYVPDQNVGELGL